MPSYEILSGLVTKVGNQEAELVLSSLKVGDTLLTNISVPNQAFFDLIEHDSNLVIGYKNSQFSNFTSRFVEGLFLGDKSTYQREMHFRRHGRDVGKSESNTVFYIRNKDNADEIFYKGYFPPMKYTKRILAAGAISIVIPYIQYIGPFLALFIVLFSNFTKKHEEAILSNMREA